MPQHKATGWKLGSRSVSGYPTGPLGSISKHYGVRQDLSVGSSANFGMAEHHNGEVADFRKLDRTIARLPRVEVDVHLRDGQSPSNEQSAAREENTFRFPRTLTDNAGVYKHANLTALLDFDEHTEIG